MSNRVSIKSGVLFSVFAPGGILILWALKTLAAEGFPIVITSGTDSEHAGPTDPHYRGEAYDVRSKSMSHDQQAAFLTRMRELLGPKFYLFLEHPGEMNEHFHIQVRKGQRVTVEDLFL